MQFHCVTETIFGNRRSVETIAGDTFKCIKKRFFSTDRRFLLGLCKNRHCHVPVSDPSPEPLEGKFLDLTTMFCSSLNTTGCGVIDCHNAHPNQ